MIHIPNILFLACVYTIVIAIGVSVADLSGFVVFGIAYAWFSVGFVVGRSGRQIRQWGRQS